MASGQIFVEHLQCQKQFICKKEECRQAFKSQGALNNHTSKEHITTIDREHIRALKIHQCVHCFSRFTERRNLNKHMKNIHSNPNTIS